MNENMQGKSVVVTGAAGGFGRQIAEKAAAMGAVVTCLDINEDALKEVVDGITSNGGKAQMAKADVTQIEDMQAGIAKAVEAFGAVDVMVNNAGVMPLAFFADHEAALGKWHQCIDINIKGVLNGMVAAYDQMVAQGRGQIINLSSIYGNFPVMGAGVYGATKAAVNVLGEAMRMESRGKIKVTTVKPTGVPGTGLAGGVVNPAATIGIVGANVAEYGDFLGKWIGGEAPAEALDENEMGYTVLDPTHISDAVIHAINQPWGVSIGDITVRASADHYIL